MYVYVSMCVCVCIYGNQNIGLVWWKVSDRTEDSDCVEEASKSTVTEWREELPLHSLFVCVPTVGYFTWKNLIGQCFG